MMGKESAGGRDYSQRHMIFRMPAGNGETFPSPVLFDQARIWGLVSRNTKPRISQDDDSPVPIVAEWGVPDFK